MRIQLETDLYEDPSPLPFSGEGPIDVARIIHRGKRNWVFEGRVCGERCAVKIPNVKSYEGCSGVERLGSEIFVDFSVENDQFMTVRKEINSIYRGSLSAGEYRERSSFHACDDPVVRQLLHSEYKTLKRAGNAWNSDAIAISYWREDIEEPIAPPEFEGKPVLHCAAVFRREGLGPIPGARTKLDVARLPAELVDRA